MGVGLIVFLGYQWSYLWAPLRTWGRCIEERRGACWRNYWRDPLSRSEYWRLYRYGRALWRAERDLRWGRNPERARRALLNLLYAQRRYAQRRRWDLLPSPRWERHRSEYYALRRYRREVERLERALRWGRAFSPQEAKRALRGAIEAEIRLLKARMRDIRRGNRYYWRDEEYRRLERCVRRLEREARRLR
ncbi:MAG TPA: hypothetical protein EYP65_05220 [Armatimonadetes bacterium]|nr:hypothetical protein [Armatimonadota bacterium]